MRRFLGFVAACAPLVAAAVLVPGASRGATPAPVKVGGIDSLGAVESGGASAPSIFTTTAPWHVVQIWTYHWNDAKGATPGRIGIRDLATRKLYGPFRATGRPGQGGVPNAYWVATVSIDLPAGRYQYVDSQPGTWAQNAETGHRGMAFLMATPGTELKWPELPSAVVSLASVSNGCGGGEAGTAQRFGDTSTYLNSNNPLGKRYHVNFREACNLHDAGYSGAKVRDPFAGGAVVDFLGKTQEQVDEKFLRDMRSLCVAQIPAEATVALADCKASGGKTSTGALTRYNIVRTFGHIFWRPRPSLAGVWKGGDPPVAVTMEHSLRYVRATWRSGSGDSAIAAEFRGTLISRDQDSVVKGTVRLKNAAKTLQRPMSITVPAKGGEILMGGGGLAGSFTH